MNTAAVFPRRRYNSYSTMYRFFFIFFVSVLFFTADVVADDDDIDGDYMSRLLDALTTPTPPPGWSNNTHFCNWNGVRCHPYSGAGGSRVHTIALPSSSLNGRLPSDLYSLTNLIHIDLHNNSLTGPLPSLMYLENLETVYLGHNNFTSIPKGCFKYLTALRTLNLSNNLNLQPWIFSINKIGPSPLLQTLDLEATNIIGSLPSNVFDWFPKLESVVLSHNYLTEDLPESLGRSRIRYLRLDNNYYNPSSPGFTGTIEVITSMRFLSQAWLHNNSFTGPIPDFSNCTNLFDLQLHSNGLSGVVPPSLMALPSLKNVSLDENFLEGPKPAFRKGVKATYEYNSFCRRNVRPCDPRVTTLLEIAASFGYPPIFSPSYWEWGNPCKDRLGLIGCRGGKIISINLENQIFGGSISPAFANLTGLVNLTLAGNNLMGSIPHSLTTLSQLQLLDVSNNSLDGPVPNFPSRVKLNITGNVLLRNHSLGRNGSVSGDAPSRGPSKSKAEPHANSLGPHIDHKKKLSPLWVTGASVCSVGVIILTVIICKRMRYHDLVQKRIFKKTTFLDHDVEDFIQNYNLSVPKQYNYAKVKRITNSFKDKLGQGGYGVVYKASLPDGRQVAVKVINETKGNGEEFINEVASISRTSHVNIVSLLGFCYEMNKKALIYEFMPNGSLDKFIYRSGFPSAMCNLGWNTLYQVAIGIARGLEYLHQGCISKILHLDIKPQKILLDEDFCPKISDFGLAKICQKKDSVVSILGTRGTVGYIAPEVFSRTFGKISHKSDVYSYGMLVLEMIGGRKNYDTGGSHTTEMYFPDWIYKYLEHGNALGNSLAISEEENDMVQKITMVSLWCIQTNPLDRPSMSKVIEMLLGPLQSVPYPPKPILYSPGRPSLQTSPVSSDNLSLEGHHYKLHPFLLIICQRQIQWSHNRLVPQNEMTSTKTKMKM